MSRIPFGLAAGLTAVLLAACASSTAAPLASAGTSPTPTTKPSSQRTSVPTTMDPCQLVTSSEASALAGVSYGPGTPDETSGGAKICRYGSETSSVFQFEVFIAQATDAATAQALWANQEAQWQAVLNPAAQGADVSTNATDFSLAGADRAAVRTLTGTYSGATVSGSAVFLLKGPIFLKFSEFALNHPAPTLDALEAQAATSLGRLP